MIRSDIKVSVIVTLFNKEEYVRKCIDSIINQTYSNIEVVIVNDGSNDNGLAICQSYDDNRIKIINQSNRGLVYSRRKGLKEAKGEFVFFVDADDWIEENTIELLVNKQNNSNADVVICNYITEYEEQKPLYRPLGITGGCYEEKDFNFDMWKAFFQSDNKFSIMHHVPEKLYRKELALRTIEKVPDCLVNGEDLVFTYELLKIADRIQICEDYLYHYRFLDNSMIHKKIRFGLLKQIDNVYETICKNDEERFISAERNAIESFIKRWVGGTLSKMFLFETGRFYLFPYEKVVANSKIVIYGYGSVGKSYYSQLCDNGYCDVVGIVDKNIECPLKIVFESVLDIDFDKIIVAINDIKTKMDIKERLLEIGVDSNKIVI